MSDSVDIVMPSSAQEGTESFVARWLRKPGEFVSIHDPLLEISTDKVTIEISAPATGILQEIIKKENEPVEAGMLLGRLKLGDAPVQKTRNKTQPDPTVELSPAVRRLLKEHQLDAAQIKGTGKDGRITHEDVQRYLDFPQGSINSSAHSSVQGESGEAPAGKRVALTPMRRTIAHRMVESALKTAPHVTALFQADVSRVIADREQRRSEFEKKGVKLTLTAYFLKAACVALGKVPEANASWRGNELELYTCCNIGVAAAVNGGLVVPVLRDAEQLDLYGLAVSLQELTTKARTNKLTPKDVQGGTFTITNHGMGGSLLATPIIHQPQSAILGIGKLEKRVIVVDDKGKDVMAIRPMIYVTLTVDHRVLDGFRANEFLTQFVFELENWGA